jgi:guanylate kinase
MIFAMHNKLIFLMGVSGSGKDTVQNALLSDDLVSVNSTVDRPLRPEEVDGEKYDFVSSDTFQQFIDEDDFIEYALVHQKYHYGTRKSLVQQIFDKGKNVLKQVDIHGREQIVAKPELRGFCRSVFMDITDDVIRQRILNRDPSISEEEIQRRLESAQYERSKAVELCDMVIDVSAMTMEEQAATMKEAVESFL